MAGVPEHGGCDDSANHSNAREADEALDMVDPQPMLVEILVRCVLLPRGSRTSWLRINISDSS